jgi:Rps23 Pro-64 3,4-dihydroxylase Tpa1-like proline 4-hydroxylase
MVIHKIKEPFPHLIIEDFYNQNELKLIWQELDFLTSANKLVPANIDGSTINSNALSASLDVIYKHLRYSNIYLINQKILSPEIKNAFFSLSELFGHITMINTLNIKIKYYENGHNYHKHRDLARFTGINYLYKEPKKFEGGDLYFNDHDYKVELKNNMFILFMGCFPHSVTPIALNENAYITGNGKYSITNFLDIYETIQ